MELSYGTRLRMHREERQVTLAAIAADSKIKLRLLEGLERDDVSEWPEGIFRRSYIRAYAQAIGLDPDQTCREFMKLYPDSVIVPERTIVWPDASPTNGPRRSVVPVFLQRESKVSPAKKDVQAAQIPEPLPEPPPPPVVEVQATAPVVDFEAEIGLTPQPLPPPPTPALPDPDTLELAQLCTSLGRVVDVTELSGLLGDVTRVLNAVGVVVWCWDAPAAVLRPWISSGYTDDACVRMPSVPATADNAVAAAFRETRTCVVSSDDAANGAVVVPLVGPAGCVGTLAAEFAGGGEQRQPVRAFATILAAQLAMLIGPASIAEAHVANA